MRHVCVFQKTNTILPLDDNASFRERLKVKLQRLIIISDENPRSHLYFRSNHYIREEGVRQICSDPYTIHPFSKFRKWYDLYLIYLYFSLLITKPIDACFMSRRRYSLIPGFIQYSLFTDVLSWIDIVLTCFTGYYIEATNSVELRRWIILKGYVTSRYCICDLISAIPKAFFAHPRYSPISAHSSIALGMVSFACLFKLMRVSSLVVYIDRLAMYVSHGQRKKVMTVCNLIVLILATHWLACLQFGVTKIFRVNLFSTHKNKTWVARAGLLNATTMAQYVHSFFKSNAYILGIQLGDIYNKELPEEYVLAALTYIIGKVLVIYAWVILAVQIMNSRSTNIKFGELINQLEEYMTRKRLPLKLRDRISMYYYYKYQKKYVKEESIADLLSSNLKHEINLHHCRSIIKNVSLFKELNHQEVSTVVERLVVEIFLPNDTIFTAGSLGTDMYFLASGTVAVYSRSGKEVCHLEEGAYFGEVSLIIPGQIRIATMVAIEMCEVYRLSRRDFYICLVNNQRVLDKMVRVAQNKLKRMKLEDEAYWKSLFERTFQSEHKLE